MRRFILVTAIAAFLPNVAAACQPSFIGQIADAMLGADAVFVARASRLDVISIDPDGLGIEKPEEWEAGPFRAITAELNIEDVWKGAPPDKVLSMNSFFCGGFWTIGVPQIFIISKDEKITTKAWKLPPELAKRPFVRLPDWTLSRGQNRFADLRVFFERIKDGEDPTKAAAGLATLRPYLRREIQPLE